MAAAEWRLPTAVENAYFADGRLWANGEDRYQLENSDYNYWINNSGNYVTDPALASLPVKDTDALTAKTQIIPAPGYRETNGTIVFRGTHGYFWPSTPLDSTTGYLLRFHSNTLYPVTSIAPTFGYSIRCVRI
jgi:hypothetical protein